MQARLLRDGAIALLAAGFVACASTPGPSAHHVAQNRPLPGKPACFWRRNFFDWTVLDDSTLIVHAPLTRDAYLVKLFQPVFGLSFHQSLGFEDVEHTGQICSQDYLIVRGYMPPRIPIVAVQALTMPEQAQLLKAAGKPVPRKG